MDLSHFGKHFYPCSGKQYFIGDVHAEYYKLASVLDQILPDLKQEDHIIFLGDIIDGPFNLKTIKLIQKVKNYHKNTFILEGNHDVRFKQFLKNGHGVLLDKFNPPRLIQDFLDLGFAKVDNNTVKEYFKNHNINIFEQMIPYYISEGLIASHAPIKECIVTNITKQYKTNKNILDNMEWFLAWEFYDRSENKFEDMKSFPDNTYFICGHQHTHKPHPILTQNKAFLDCGAGYFPKSKLFALEYPSKNIISSSLDKNYKMIFSLD